jgi:hypothetical protein
MQSHGDLTHSLVAHRAGESRVQGALPGNGALSRNWIISVRTQDVIENTRPSFSEAREPNPKDTDLGIRFRPFFACFRTLEANTRTQYHPPNA